MSASPNYRHLSDLPGCSLFKGGDMKSSKKVNWKPPQVTMNEKSIRTKLSQDQINAELNEMSMTMTEWYVEGEKNGRA